MMTIVPTVVMPLSSAARSGTTAAFTISGEPLARRARSSGAATASLPAAHRGAPRTKRFDERRVEQIVEAAGRWHRPARRRTARSSARIPADDAIVQIEHEQAVVKRFENVLVERAHPIELERLDVQLAIQACVFERRGDLSGHGAEQAPCPRC